MRDIAELTEEDLTRSLAYAGFVLVAYELVKSLIVGPIKAFYYESTEMISRMTWSSGLVSSTLPNIGRLLEKADRALFKLSNHQTYMEIGSDPAFQNKGINWDTLKGHEYVLFEEVLKKVKLLDRGTK